MFSCSVTSKKLSFLFHRHKVISYEALTVPFQAYFSTHIVGDKPLLVRDFIHSALYDPKHGYFSQRSRSVGILQKSIKFNQLEGRKAYLNYLDKIYRQSGISWFTPVELFKPWYAHGIAEAIMRTANLSVPLKLSIPRERVIFSVCVSRISAIRNSSRRSDCRASLTDSTA